MAETVLVTGGTGYVAGWCILKLLERGYNARTTIRSIAKEPEVRSALKSAGVYDEHLTFFIADLTKDNGWDNVMEGCDFVLHVASPIGAATSSNRASLSFVEPARDGTLRVLKAAVQAGVRRVVMTSAAAAARPSLTTARDSDETIWADPEDPQFDAYRVSKILAERAAWEFMKRNGGTTQFTSILPGAVFGPIMTNENKGSVKIIQDLLQGHPPAVPRLGFWVVDVRDLADLHIRAMTSSEAAGERFIAAGEFMWMLDMSKTLRTTLGSRAAKSPSRQLPDFLVRLMMPFMPQLKTLAPLIGRRFGLTTEKAHRVLGFEPRPAAITLTECAESLLDGFKQHFRS